MALVKCIKLLRKPGLLVCLDARPVILPNAPFKCATFHIPSTLRHTQTDKKAKEKRKEQASKMWAY